VAAVSPYATAKVLNRPTEAHVVPGVWNQDRLQAYATYEDIWNNVPEAFTALLRAGDDPLSRRYIPFMRSLIESTNRYLAVSIDHVWTADAGATVSDDQMTEWGDRLAKLWAREEVPIKLSSLKRWTLIRGDGLLMVSADPAKAEGSRIRITEVLPSQYFPMVDPSDGERIVGCYLASVVQNDEGDDVIQRIEYRRVLNEEQSAELNGAPVGSIFYRLGFYELTGWDDRPDLGDDKQDLAPVDPPTWALPSPDAEADVFAGVALPALITSLPVYHFRNSRRGGKEGLFGVSEVQGLESLLAGLTQNATDEDTAVAMQGLGVYWTDSGKPKDARGREVEWEIGPASMLELEKDGKVGRVDGISSVQPLQDHMKMLQGAGREATAIPDVAVGRIDAQTASSGVALRIEFMPVVSKNSEKEMEMGSKLTQLLFDLQTMWFPTYEAWSALPIQPSLLFGDPIPVDRQAVITEITQLVASGIASKEWAAKYLSEKLGYDFPADMVAKAAAEQQSALDAMGGRIDAAAGNAPTDPAVEDV
jgi:hypothetical protein